MNNQSKFKKGLQIIEKLQFASLILISFALIVGLEFLTADVGWEMVTDSYFYISNSITLAALFLVTLGTVFLYLDNYKATDEIYLGAKREIDDFALSEENIPSIFCRFLERINRKRKINQYKFNIRIKLHKLENTKKWYAYLPILKHLVRNPYYYSEEEMHIWNFGTEEEKAKSKYCRKRKMYEEQLMDCVIEKTIDTKFIKYDKITTETILNEYYNKGSENRVNDFITKNENAQIARFRIPTLIVSFGLTLTMASLVLDGIHLNYMAIITILSKLFAIAWNIFTSYRYGRKHSINITLHDILFRKSIITEYKKWLVEEAEKTEEDIILLPLQKQE